MNRDTANKVLDPFFTTRKVRNVGLGLPLFEHAAKTANGHLSVKTETGKGTHVLAQFMHSHIDRQPLGSMSETITVLIAGNPDIDFFYTHKNDGRIFTLDTRDIKKELEDVPINNTEVLKLIRENIEEGLKEIGIKNNG